MPAYDFNQLLTDAMTVVAATWTDVVADGIWEYDEAVRESWEQRTLPYAVFELGMPEPAEWGLTNRSHEVELKVNYIATEATTMATVRTKLAALESAMFAAGAFTTSQATLLADTHLDWSPENPINAVCYGKNMPVLAGTVTFRFAVGVTVV